MSINNRISSSVLLSCVIVVAVACSSSTSSPNDPDASSPVDASSGSDTSTTPDAGNDTGGNLPDGSTTCPSIANTAPIVTSSVMNGVTAPTGTGGTIADGTYYMTAQMQYMGGDNSPEDQKYTIKITGNQLDLTGHSGAKSEQSVTVTMANNTATGAAKWTVVCPAALAGKDFGITSYTATATTVTFYKPTNGAIFTKQ